MKAGFGPTFTQRVPVLGNVENRGKIAKLPLRSLTQNCEAALG